MNLIYMVFGPGFNNHLQANFSILSFLSANEGVDKIFIVTDDAHYYNVLDKKDVEIILISQEQLDEWQEPYGFFWRIKIKAIEHVISNHKAGNWLYLDSDTFLYNDLVQIKSKLDRGESVMHLNEGKLSQLGSKTEKLMWKQCREKTFQNILITEDSCMWNAGVIGLPAATAPELIREVLKVCDEMCAAVITRRLIEQFAFSIVLHDKTTLTKCDPDIIHYWANKSGWNPFILEAFAKNYLSNGDSVKNLPDFKKLLMNKPAIYKKESTTRVKLEKLALKIFPDKDSVHLN